MKYITTLLEKSQVKKTTPIVIFITTSWAGIQPFCLLSIVSQLIAGAPVPKKKLHLQVRTESSNYDKYKLQSYGICWKSFYFLLYVRLSCSQFLGQYFLAFSLQKRQENHRILPLFNFASIQHNTSIMSRKAKHIKCLHRMWENKLNFTQNITQKWHTVLYGSGICKGLLFLEGLLLFSKPSVMRFWKTLSLMASHWRKLACGPN